jgi:hypothetical protein
MNRQESLEVWLETHTAKCTIDFYKEWALQIYLVNWTVGRLREIAIHRYSSLELLWGTLENLLHRMNVIHKYTIESWKRPGSHVADRLVRHKAFHLHVWPWWIKHWGPMRWWPNTSPIPPLCFLLSFACHKPLNKGCRLSGVGMLLRDGNPSEPLDAAFRDIKDSPWAPLPS